MKESKTHDVSSPSTGERCAGVGLGSYAMHGEALHVDGFNLHMGDGVEYVKYYGKAMYDAIVVLGGGRELSVGRIEEGIRLFKQGIARYLIVVAGKDDAPLMRERIVEEIKDPSNVYIDDNSTSTVDNAYYAKRILVKLNARRILIVTSKFHLKRALSVFKLFLRDGYEIEGVGVEDNPDDYTLAKEMYLDELLYLLDYFQGMSDEKIKAIFDMIKGPVNKVLRKAYESGILPKPKK